MYYTKYRPQKFSEILKPNSTIDALVSQISSGKISHAYLFVGPRGTGKTTTARILVKAINCKKVAKNSDPCGECSSCLDIQAGIYPDLIEIDAASNRGIDDIRELKSKVKLAPSVGKYKCYIIDEVHMLSTEAFNALLKTLEEPPKNVIFILCTTELHKVPETIKSRCQLYKFQKATINQLKEKLHKIVLEEKIKIDDQTLNKIAKAATGGYRDAENLLQQVAEGEVSIDSLISVSSWDKYIDFVNYMSTNDTASALDFIRKLDDEGVDLYTWGGELLDYLRKMLFIKSKADIEINELTEETLSLFNDQVNKADFAWIVSCLENFSKAHQETKGSYISSLPLEIAIIKSTIKLQEEKSVTTNVNPKLPDNPNQDKPTRMGSSGKTSIEIKQSSYDYVKKGKEESVHMSKDEVKVDITQPSMDLEEIKDKWTLVLEKVNGKNSSISSLLKTGILVGIEGKKLILEVSYEFYKERLESTKNIKYIEGILDEVYSTPLSIMCKVNPEHPKRLKKGEVGILTDYNVIPAQKKFDKDAAIDMLDGGLPL